MTVYSTQTSGTIAMTNADANSTLRDAVLDLAAGADRVKGRRLDRHDRASRPSSSAHPSAGCESGKRVDDEGQDEQHEARRDVGAGLVVVR